MLLCFTDIHLAVQRLPALRYGVFWRFSKGYILRFLSILSVQWVILTLIYIQKVVWISCMFSTYFFTFLSYLPLFGGRWGGGVILDFIGNVNEFLDTLRFFLICLPMVFQLSSPLSFYHYLSLFFLPFSLSLPPTVSSLICVYPSLRSSFPPSPLFSFAPDAPKPLPALQYPQWTGIRRAL